jgi:nucleoside 2-deoxyribosyltransferase
MIQKAQRACLSCLEEAVVFKVRSRIKCIEKNLFLSYCCRTLFLLLSKKSNRMNNGSKIQSTSKPKIYLAGPEVFLPAPISEGRKKKDLCRKFGFEGVFPLDAGFDPIELPKREQGGRISQNNELLIGSCDLLIANMTPFRGPSMDVGTAFEIGFARALGKPVFGYTNDARKFTDRTIEFLGQNIEKNNGRLEDGHGMEIEDFDLTDNLMIDGAVHAATSTWVVVPEESKKDYYSDLSGFEECLSLARRFMEYKA